MTKAEDLAVVIFAASADQAGTLRVALRGMGVRNIHVTSTPEQTAKALTDAKPHVMVVYVGQDETDDGLRMIRFIRRWDGSPNPHVPIVAVSPRRDIAGISAVREAGVHEYAVFPVSSDELFRKVTAAIQSTRDFVSQTDYVGPCRRRRGDPNYEGPERRATKPSS